MPEFALDKRLATGLPLRSLLAKTGTSDAVSRILPPPSTPDPPDVTATAPLPPATRSASRLPQRLSPPPSQPLASSVHASSPRFSQHQSSARTAPALSYTTTPTRRPKPRLRGASLQLWLRRNADFFTCMPQSDDALLHISAIHASVRDGGRASCVAPRMHRLLAHNEMHALHVALRRLRDGWREGAVCSPPSRA